MREFIRRCEIPDIVIPGERQSGELEAVFESVGAFVLWVKTLNILKTNFIENDVALFLLKVNI